MHTTKFHDMKFMKRQNRSINVENRTVISWNGEADKEIKRKWF